MSTASMALLKGSQKKPALSTVEAASAELEKDMAPVAGKVPAAAKTSSVKKVTKAPDPKPKPEPVPTPDPVVEPVDDAVQIEVDDMNTAQIAALVAEHSIDVPEGWAGFELQAQKDWLNEQFGEAAQGEAANEMPDNPASAKAAKAPRKSKAVAAQTPAVEAATEATAKPAKGKVKPDAGPDIITETSSNLENLKEPEARKLVGELRERGEFGYFQLGGVLAIIQENNWFTPHATLKDLIEAEHGIKYTRAMYYVRIYKAVVGCGVVWDQVKTAGWSKLLVFSEVLTKDNVKHWVKTAEKQTVLQLKETVKAHILAEKQQAGGEQVTATATPVVTKTFKLHPDQKATIDEALAKAKDVSKTTYDTVAFEYMALDYLAGTGNAGSLAGQLQKVGLDEALKAFEQAFPNVGLTAEVEEAAAEAA